MTITTCLCALAATQCASNRNALACLNQHVLNAVKSWHPKSNTQLFRCISPITQSSLTAQTSKASTTKVVYTVNTMSTNELTPWFDAIVKPARVGVYQVDWKPSAQESEYQWYAYWDGREWGWMAISISRAIASYNLNPDRRHKELAWRGLASEPKS